MIVWIGTAETPEDQAVIESLSGQFHVSLHPTLREACQHFRSQSVEAAVLSRSSAEHVEVPLLESIRDSNPQMPILLDGREEARIDDSLLNRLRVLRLPAEWHSPQAMARRIASAVEACGSGALMASRQRNREPWRSMIVGDSPAIERVVESIRLVAARRSTVLITGETGTGKEVVARAIHAASPRAQQPMVTVNCGALPENLLETELFGHAKGAFTGAVGQRMGRFEQAHRGTIFLDEIGDMPVALQTGLLRVLQEREFQRVGGLETVRVDVRVIAATNVDLERAVESRTFRSDLLYRLRVFTIRIPPLRERVEDIPSLATHFVEKICRDERIEPKHLSASALDRLMNRDWPGNVRELQHAVEMAIIMSGDRLVMDADDFSPHEPPHGGETSREAPVVLPDDGVDFEELINNIQRALLQQALEKTNGNKARAASLLNMKRSTLVSKVKALNE